MVEECLMGGPHVRIDSPDKFDPYNACTKCGADIRKKNGEWIETDYEEREFYNEHGKWPDGAKEAKKNVLQKIRDEVATYGQYSPSLDNVWSELDSWDEKTEILGGPLLNTVSDEEVLKNLDRMISKTNANEFKPEMQGKTVTIIEGPYAGKTGTVTMVEIFGDDITVNIDGEDVDVEDGNYSISNEHRADILREAQVLSVETFTGQCKECGEYYEDSVEDHCTACGAGLDDNVSEEGSQIGVHPDKVGNLRNPDGSFANRDTYDNYKTAHGFDDATEDFFDDGVEAMKWNLIFEDTGEDWGFQTNNKAEAQRAVDDWNADGASGTGRYIKIAGESGLYGYGSATGRMSPAEHWKQGLDAYGPMGYDSKLHSPLFDEFNHMKWSELPEDIKQTYMAKHDYMDTTQSGDENLIAIENWKKLADDLLDQHQKKGKKKGGEVVATEKGETYVFFWNNSGMNYDTRALLLREAMLDETYASNSNWDSLPEHIKNGLKPVMNAMFYDVSAESKADEAKVKEIQNGEWFFSVIDDPSGIDGYYDVLVGRNDINTGFTAGASASFVDGEVVQNLEREFNSKPQGLIDILHSDAY